MTDAELLAERHDGVERFDAEVDAAVEVAEIRELDAERLVHRSEVEQSIRLHSALIQRGASAGQPAVAGRPPESVIRPIQRDI